MLEIAKTKKNNYHGIRAENGDGNDSITPYIPGSILWSRYSLLQRMFCGQKRPLPASPPHHEVGGDKR